LGGKIVSRKIRSKEERKGAVGPTKKAQERGFPETKSKGRSPQ